MKKEPFKQTPFNKIFEDARKEKGVTLNEVAKITGITRQYIRAIETGEKGNVSFDIVVRLARYYRLDLNEIAILVVPKDYKRGPRHKEDDEIE